jgi:hypothetical protein
VNNKRLQSGDFGFPVCFPFVDKEILSVGLGRHDLYEKDRQCGQNGTNGKHTGTKLDIPRVAMWLSRSQ